MATPLEHLKEVGMFGYPAAVSVRAIPAPAPAAVPAAPEASSAASASTAAGKKEKSGKKGSDKQDVAPAAPTGGPPAEKTKAELEKMSKEDRKAYWEAKRYWDAKLAAESSAGAGDNATSAKSSKASKQERREMQEAQRKAKADKADTAKEGDELFEELKLQGLTEDQAREVMREMLAQGGEPIEEEEEDDAGDVEDLLGSVRRWMGEQLEKLPEDALRDFNMKVRFQGHVNSTPPDHLDAILQVLVGQACGTCDWAAKNLHTQVSKALQPLLERWAVLLRPLYGKIGDVLDAFSAVVSGITKSLEASGAPEASKEPAVVGCLMAVREIDDLVDDEDLLVGCKGMETRGRVLDQFIEFLESCLEDDEEDDEDDE